MRVKSYYMHLYFDSLNAIFLNKIISNLHEIKLMTRFQRENDQIICKSKTKHCDSARFYLL